MLLCAVLDGLQARTDTLSLLGEKHNLVLFFLQLFLQTVSNLVVVLFI